MDRLTISSTLLAAIAFLAASAGTAQESDEPKEKEDTIYADDESVPSVKCIRPKMIKATRVIDGRNILFVMRGNKIYRNVLPRECAELDRFGTFSYPSTYGRLCDIDQIAVVGGASGFGGGINCRLGKFYPVTIEEVNAIAREAELVKELDTEIE